MTEKELKQKDKSKGIAWVKIREMSLTKLIFGGSVPQFARTLHSAGPTLPNFQMHPVRHSRKLYLRSITCFCLPAVLGLRRAARAGRED